MDEKTRQNARDGLGRAMTQPPQVKWWLVRFKPMAQLQWGDKQILKRENVQFLPGWLVMSDGPEFSIQEGVSAWPSEDIRVLEQIMPGDDDICAHADCFVLRIHHDQDSAHRFVWDPTVHMQKREQMEHARLMGPVAGGEDG